MDINILVSTDEKYLFQTCVMLKSLFRIHIKDRFFVYAMVNDIQEKSKKYLSDFVERCTHTIIMIDLTIEDYKTIGVDKYFKDVEKSDHITMATFNRLLLLSKECQKCDYLLYLDSDIIINKPIYDLYESLKLRTDKYASVVEGFTFKDEDFVLIASLSSKKVKEIQTHASNHKRRTGFPSGKKYFNAGVILFNIAKLKEIQFQDVVKEFVQTHDCFDHDQYILNSIFMDHVYWAPFIYNCRPGDFDKSQKRYLKEFVAIIHYSVKPWKQKCVLWGAWWKAAFLTDAKRSMKILINLLCWMK